MIITVISTLFIYLQTWYEICNVDDLLLYVFVWFCVISEHRTYLRQRFDELLDINEALSVRIVSQNHMLT